MMLTIICQECNSEFKVSGTDFDEHRYDGTLDLCPVCMKKKKTMPCKPKVISKSKKAILKESNEKESKYGEGEEKGILL